MFPLSMEHEHLIRWASHGATKKHLAMGFGVSMDGASYIQQKCPTRRKYPKATDLNRILDRKPEHAPAMIVFSQLLQWAESQWGEVSLDVLNHLISVFLSMDVGDPGVPILFRIYTLKWKPSEEQITKAIDRQNSLAIGSDAIEFDHYSVPPVFANRRTARRLARIRMRLSHIKEMAGVKESEAAEIYRHENGRGAPSGPLPVDIISYVTRSSDQQIHASYFLQFAALTGAIHTDDVGAFASAYEAYMNSSIDPDLMFQSSHAKILLDRVKCPQGRKEMTPCQCGLPIFPSRGIYQATECAVCRLIGEPRKPRPEIAARLKELWK